VEVQLHDYVGTQIPDYVGAPGIPEFFILVFSPKMGRIALESYYQWAHVLLHNHHILVADVCTRDFLVHMEVLSKEKLPI
jgi:hypothetical protein